MSSVPLEGMAPHWVEKALECREQSQPRPATLSISMLGNADFAAQSRMTHPAFLLPHILAAEVAADRFYLPKQMPLHSLLQVVVAVEWDLVAEAAKLFTTNTLVLMHPPQLQA
jgi:hypothetical protein